MTTTRTRKPRKVSDERRQEIECRRAEIEAAAELAGVDVRTVQRVKRELNGAAK
jgi:hypothetical protein